VHREADVIEEILRIYGYNYIYPDKNIKIPAIHSDKPDKHKLKGTISDMLAAGGFAEIMSNSLTSTAFYYDIKYFKQENTVKLHNPLSSNLDGLRQTMLYGGLEAIIYNVNRKVSDLQLFEFGTCYHFHAGKDTKNPLQQYSEAEHLAVFITGNKSEASWNSKPKVTDFYYLKSYVEKIMLRTGIDPALANTTDILNDIFRYGLAYSFNNITLAEFGAIRKNIPEKFGLDNTVFYADLRWDNIYNLAMNNNISYSEIPRFPGVKRDLALLIDKKTRFDEIKKLALKTEKKLLKKVNIFDIYEGEKLGENKKSYAISFYLQDNEKTLTDQMIETIMQNLIRTFEKELGAAIR
jgi:phenylalanyl-tRNA synthetase beta chain